MRATSILTGGALFAAGVVTGWMLANWPQQAHRATTPVATSGLAQQSVDVPPSDEDADSLWLTVEFDGGSTLVPAARIRDTNLLIAPLYSVYPANAVYYINTSGEQVFPGVVAADHISNLIAFGDKHQGGLSVSDEDGSLYIGRTVALQQPLNTLDGQIESALQTAPNGRNYFNVAFTRSEGLRGGPLVDLNASELIGFVTTSRRTERGWMHLAGDIYSAVDASTVRSFLRSTLTISSSQPAESVREFSARFEGAPGGLRHSIALYAKRGQWGEVYQALDKLTSLDDNNSDTTQAALTLAAYHYGHQLVDAGDTAEAITLSTDMRQRFPQQQPWCLVEARAYAHANTQRFDSAFASARSCLENPYGTQPQIATHLSSPFERSLNRIDTSASVLTLAHDVAIKFTTTSTAPRSEKTTLLLSALELGEHPVIYRLLGDLEYEAQSYQAAQNYYRAAIRLDPSITAALGNRLRNSTQRADSAPASEIDFEQRGGGMVVSAMLNDSPQSFRLLVDTGATYSALSGATLLRLGLGNVLNSVSQVVELEAAGGTIYARRITLDSMQIGNARVTGIPVVILENMEGFDGLVGLSFLQHFDVSLDQDAGKLILVRR